MSFPGLKNKSKGKGASATPKSGKQHRRVHSAPVIPVLTDTPKRVQFNVPEKGPSSTSSMPHSPGVGDDDFPELPDLPDSAKQEESQPGGRQQPQPAAPKEKSRQRRASVGGVKTDAPSTTEPNFKVRSADGKPASGLKAESPTREKARREVLLANFLKLTGLAELDDRDLHQRLLSGLNASLQDEDELSLATLRDRAIELLKNEPGEVAAALREALAKSDLRMASPRGHTLSKARLPWNRTSPPPSGTPRRGVLSRARAKGEPQSSAGKAAKVAGDTMASVTAPSLVDCQREVEQDIKQWLQGKAPDAAQWLRANLPPLLHKLPATPALRGLRLGLFPTALRDYLKAHPQAADADQVRRVLQRLENGENEGNESEEGSSAEQRALPPASTASTSSTPNISSTVPGSKPARDDEDDDIVGTQSTSGEDSSDELYEIENQTRAIVDLLFKARVDKLKKVWSNSKNKTGEPPDFFAVRDSDLRTFSRDDDPPEAFKTFNTEQLRPGRGAKALRKLVSYLEQNHRDGDGSLYESLEQPASPASTGKSSSDATGAWLETKSTQQQQRPTAILQKMAGKVLKHMLDVDQLPQALKVELRQADRRLIDLWMRSVKEGKNPPSARGLLDGRLALAQAICGLVGYTRLISEQQGEDPPMNPIGLRVMRGLLLRGLNPLHNADAAKFYEQVLRESEQALPDRHRWQVEKARASVAAASTASPSSTASPASPRSPASTSSPPATGSASSTSSPPAKKRGV